MAPAVRCSGGTVEREAVDQTPVAMLDRALMVTVEAITEGEDWKLGPDLHRIGSGPRSRPRWRRRGVEHRRAQEPAMGSVVG